MELIAFAALALLAPALAVPINPQMTFRFVSPTHTYSQGIDLMSAATEYVTDDSQLQELHSLQPETEPADVLSGPELEAFAASFVSNEPRFFHQFPHERALLANIQLRLSQNLPTLRTGSIRPGSPFLRA